MKKSEINSIIKLGTYHIFYKNKYFPQLSTPIPKKTQELIKIHVNPPSTNKKVFLVRIEYDSKQPDKKITITISQKIITPKLGFITEPNGDTICVIYSNDELNKHGFKLSHIKKIIDKLKNKKINLEKNIINISEILN